jgi:hypothetical protein
VISQMGKPYELKDQVYRKIGAARPFRGVGR